eukprot:m.22177 g.22177  ORF g.22177 m.22177 type:complete len:62 (-) comp10664_c0_seq1:102-287(-)
MKTKAEFFGVSMMKCGWGFWTSDREDLLLASSHCGFHVRLPAALHTGNFPVSKSTKFQVWS